MPKTAAAARTRFLHIPGTRGLTALPSSIGSLLFTPLGRAIARAGAREPLRSYPDALQLAAEDGDQSLHEFLSARLGPELARILGSALVHGIYAADSKLLSVRAAFPSIWELAKDGRGSIVRGMLSRMLKRRTSTAAYDDYDLGDVPGIMQAASVYSFKEGMTVLPTALQKAVAGHRNVELVVNDGVDVIQRDVTNEFTVSLTHDHSHYSDLFVVRSEHDPAGHFLRRTSSLLCRCLPFTLYWSDPPSLCYHI